MRNLLLILLCLPAFLSAQTDTLPLTFDYAVGLQVSRDVEGYCIGTPTKIYRDSLNYSWSRTELRNCHYLDAAGHPIDLDQIWITSPLPQEPWQRGARLNYGSIAGSAPYSPGTRVRDTFQILLTYESPDRQMHYAAPGECYCTGWSIPTHDATGPTTVVSYESCQWVSHEFGPLPATARVLIAEGLPVPRVLAQRE